MPTTINDQFFVMDPANPPPSGTLLTVVNFDITDQNDDADIDQFDGDSVDGVDITRSWPGDTVTINVPGVGNVTYSGATFYLADGRAVFTPTDGQVLQSGTLVGATFVTSQGPVDLVDFEETVPCFTPGTLIATPDGDVAVDALTVGDLVLTLDNGPQPIRWIGRRQVPGSGRMAPVRFSAGALGNHRPLLVSPQHRMLVRGWKAELLFGESEVLVAAQHLVDGDRVARAPCPTVDYIHLAFDRHEILNSDGAWTESFNPGASVLDGDRALRAELTTLFPEAPLRAASRFYPPARPGPRGAEARALAGFGA